MISARHAGTHPACCCTHPLAPPCGAHLAPAVAQEQFEFDEPDFALIDTLFSLAEAHLFMQLVTLHDADPGAIPGNKQLPDMYRPAPFPPPPSCSCGFAGQQQQHTAISAATHDTGSACKCFVTAESGMATISGSRVLNACTCAGMCGQQWTGATAMAASRRRSLQTLPSTFMRCAAPGFQAGSDQRSAPVLYLVQGRHGRYCTLPLRSGLGASAGSNGKMV